MKDQKNIHALSALYGIYSTAKHFDVWIHHDIYIYIYSTLTPNIKGTDSSVFFIYRHTFYHIRFYIFQMLFTTLENNALTSGLVKEHKVLHSSSPSLATSINSNYYKPFKALVLLVLYWDWGWGLEASYSTQLHLMLYFLYSTHTGALTNTYIYIYIIYISFIYNIIYIISSSLMIST